MPNPRVKRQRVVAVNNQTDLDRLLDFAETDMDLDAPLSDRINTLEDQEQQVAGGRSYVEANSSTLRGAFAPQTPRQVLQDLQDARDTLSEAIERLYALAAARQNFANRQVLNPSAGHQAGDGNCYVTFVNVGAGDCTLITTPLGTRIMIDCGSDSQEDVILDPAFDPATGLTSLDFIADTVKSATFLNGRPTIDLLLLTHPDSDHYNLLPGVLAAIPGMTVGMVYYGGTEDFSAFREGQTSSYLRALTGNLRKVTLRDDVDDDVPSVSSTINDARLPTAATAPNLLGAEFVDPQSRIVVYHEQDANGLASDFRISVLAGNVTGVLIGGQFIGRETALKTPTEPTIDSTETNRRSLVIMVECFGRTLLVTGDATAVTEAFTVRMFGGVLANVQTLRMGHHGSPTSSSMRLLNALPNLQEAVASSSGKNTVGHHLPKRATLALYPSKVQSNAAAHDIYAFDGDQSPIALLCYQGISSRLFTTGSNGTVELALPHP